MTKVWRARQLEQPTHGQLLSMVNTGANLSSGKGKEEEPEDRSNQSSLSSWSQEAEAKRSESEEETKKSKNEEETKSNEEEDNGSNKEPKGLVAMSVSKAEAKEGSASSTPGSGAPKGKAEGATPALEGMGSPSPGCKKNEEQCMLGDEGGPEDDFNRCRDLEEDLRGCGQRLGAAHGAQQQEEQSLTALDEMASLGQLEDKLGTSGDDLKIWSDEEQRWS